MPLQLLAAPAARRARGLLYWDHGDTLNSYEEKQYSHIEFVLNYTELKSEVHWWGYGVPPVDRVTLLGQPRPVRGVAIDGAPCLQPCQFTYNPNNKVLEIFNITLALDKPFSIKWTFKLITPFVNRVEKVRNDTLV
ncbi:sucrase-isomaltase, intestinal-like [Cydia pomonella]|uniref:sucrase-isomaltase, intestinal-like n=1 Tax=Cydia pomonella TaxID=82600 RepID=UPI002ADD5A31|nr:sucrase-isomaltase, intestinal-like [Cydia pomonella]